MAQQGQQVPLRGVEGDVSGWVKLCAKDEQSGNASVCLVKYEELDPSKLARFFCQPRCAPSKVRMDNSSSSMCPIAYTLIISAGLQARIDEGEPVSMQFSVCLPTSCQAQMALNKEMLQKMMGGKKLVVAAANMQKKSMVFPVPLLGFQ